MLDTTPDGNRTVNAADRPGQGQPEQAKYGHDRRKDSWPVRPHGIPREQAPQQCSKQIASDDPPGDVDSIQLTHTPVFAAVILPKAINRPGKKEETTHQARPDRTSDGFVHA